MSPVAVAHALWLTLRSAHSWHCVYLCINFNSFWMFPMLWMSSSLRASSQCVVCIVMCIEYMCSWLAKAHTQHTAPCESARAPFPYVMDVCLYNWLPDKKCVYLVYLFLFSVAILYVSIYLLFYGDVILCEYFICFICFICLLKYTSATVFGAIACLCGYLYITVDVSFCSFVVAFFFYWHANCFLNI